MHIETRTTGKNKKKYYLAYSYRDDGKIRKIRKYLGQNLSKNDLEKLKKSAEKEIKKKIETKKHIPPDPLHTVLTTNIELKEIETLIATGEAEIKYLSETDWQIFTEIFTYDTNAIEGSTVNLSEVKKILEKDTWPKKRSKEEISETYGVAEAIRYIRKTREHISLGLIKTLHKIVFRNSKQEFAGRFRGKNMEVAVVDSFGRIIHRGAPQNKIITLLKELISWYEKNKKRYHPVLLSAVIHNQFENIHPFQDGNGRVGRLLLNNILLKHNFPPVNIEFKNRQDYYQSLREYENNGNIRPTLELILKEYKSLKRYLKKW